MADKARNGGPLSIMLLTDVFPPGSGGSGWSTYYLGSALQERGHKVRVVRPIYGQNVASVGARRSKYGDLEVVELLIPTVGRWQRKLGIAKALEERRAERAMEVLAARSGFDVLHGQHAVSAGAACAAAFRARKRENCPVSVATVRDYWPLCPNSTRLFNNREGHYFECRNCHKPANFLACAGRHVRGTSVGGMSRVSNSLRTVGLWARWARTRQRAYSLARCDAVIAVSDYVRGELARSGRVPARKLVAIPNLVEMPSVEAALRGAWPLHDISTEEPFLLFAGKLDPNKGADQLPAALEKSGVRLPLVLAGDGPLRQAIESEAGQRGLRLHFADWLDNDDVLLLMHHAQALLFPSAWQEPLSRVLLEGCAVGAAIVAQNTGGTEDVITHGESGWLAADSGQFVEGIRQVATDTTLNCTLRAGARRRAQERFAAPVVSAQVEALYRKLLSEARP